MELISVDFKQEMQIQMSGWVLLVSKVMQVVILLLVQMQEYMHKHQLITLEVVLLLI